MLTAYNDSIRATLDLSALLDLPEYNPRGNRRISDRAGLGCYGDPPGHPSYYLRSVYDWQGNDHPGDPNAVIVFLGQAYIVLPSDYNYDDRESYLRTLYIPLPWHHPRVQAWVLATFAHCAHCYRDEAHPKYGRPGILVYPLSYSDRHDYELEVLLADERFSDSWKAQESARLNALNDEVERAARATATFDNHLAVRIVRKYYPDAPVAEMQALIDHPPKSIGNWWERELVRPTPVNCPGDVKVSLTHSSRSWCQYCGYTTTEAL